MDVADKKKREYFGIVFSELLNKWMKSSGKNQQDFVKEIGVSKNVVIAWKNGTSFPRNSQLKKICIFFDVEEEKFLPSSWIAKAVVYNQEAIRRSEELEKYAISIGLDDHFYTSVTSAKDFISTFPFHDIEHFPGELAIAQTSYGYELVKYQFRDKTGYRIMLNEEDLDYLRKIQDKGEKYIRQLYLMEKTKLNDKMLYSIISNVKSEENGADAETLYISMTDHTLPELYAKWATKKRSAFMDAYKTLGYNEIEAAEKAEEKISAPMTLDAINNAMDIRNPKGKKD